MWRKLNRAQLASQSNGMVIDKNGAVHDRKGRFDKKPGATPQLRLTKAPSSVIYVSCSDCGSEFDLDNSQSETQCANCYADGMDNPPGGGDGGDNGGGNDDGSGKKCECDCDCSCGCTETSCACNELNNCGCYCHCWEAGGSQAVPPNDAHCHACGSTVTRNGGYIGGKWHCAKCLAPIVYVPLTNEEKKRAVLAGVRFNPVPAEVKAKYSRNCQSGENIEMPVLDSKWTGFALELLRNDMGGCRNTDNQSAWGTRRTAYWKARQDALKTNKIRDLLPPHEVVFYEEFISYLSSNKRGYIRLIEKDRSHLVPQPTNDFIWYDASGIEFPVGSIEVELKATKKHYKTIREAIVNEISNAPNKKCFIINLGKASLSDKLISELSRYNQQHQNHRIEKLWVWADGKLTEIEQL